MSDRAEAVTFLSCFKCGRIVRSTDDECPRCGMKFGPGTLFECPFCAGLVWRSAERCSSCKTDLVKFSKEIGENLEGFSMDGFVDKMIETEMTNIRHDTLRMACPSCGLMIRGNEERCPRCDMILKGVKVDCPVCGEKVVLTDMKCKNCGTTFHEIEEEEEERVQEESQAIKAQMSEGPDADLLKIRAILASARANQQEPEGEDGKREKSSKGKKKKFGFRKK
jgi:predicted RNA-binding Zn-ribbon protein involved in translation (DUF1610 family)